MKIIKYLKRSMAIITCLALVLSVSVSCNDNGTTSTEEETTGGGETTTNENFDFANADISEYISLDPSAYHDMTVSIDKKYEITDKNVQSYIQGVLENNPQPVKIIDRPIAKGDTVMIYYQGLLDGVAFSGGTYAEEVTDSSGNKVTQEPYELKIGSGSFIDGFEDGLIGVVPQETSKDNPAVLNLTFPSNYHVADLAGKSVVFNVYVKYIKGGTYIPDYNEDTVVNILGFDAKGNDVLSEFEEVIKEQLEYDREEQLLSAASNIIIEKATVKSYPQQALDYYYQYYVDQFQQYVDYYTMYGYPTTLDEMARTLLGLNEGDDWQAATAELAKNITKSTMVTYEIAQQQGFTVTEAEFDERVQLYIDYYKEQGTVYTADEIINGVGESTLREEILFSKVDAYLIEQCKNVTYSDKSE